MKYLSLVICLLAIVGMTLFGCGTNNETNNTEDIIEGEEIQNTLDGEKKSVSSDGVSVHNTDAKNDEEKHYSSEIEEVRVKGRKELDIERIFIPEMKEFKMANAFVSYSGNEPMTLDVQYHVERGEKQKQFNNEIVIEEHKEKLGMKYLIPPYTNNGDMHFWFIYSKFDVPEMINDENDGIEEEWIQIEGSKVLFTNNGTDYRFYLDDEKGHYMFGYTIDHYSKDEAKDITSNFIEKIKTGEYK
ncbi:hypothetical protein [Alkalihalobacterium alkalinitrilicum]|uniref:hypothetical protein n=1 Tax=Alkalihalobacterium alkalinitrilicum TaxID=427920 RepID=UPI000994EEFE|nr:hypothetical protein [Alkalihalobacterium alkalinitrilicum]